MAFCMRKIFGFFLPFLLLAILFTSASSGFGYEKFPIRSNPIELQGNARPGVYCEAVGRRAALLGSEQGIFESWVFPFKILHHLHFKVLLPGRSEPLMLSQLARRIIVRPDVTTIVYSHQSFTIRQHLFTPEYSAGSVILFDVDTDIPFQIIVNFQPDLTPMWPAGLGGQFCYWDDEQSAYIISESRWLYSGIIGSPFGKRISSPPAHQLSDQPTQFVLSVRPGQADSIYYPVVIAGSVKKGLDDLFSTYRLVLESLAEKYQETVAHYDSLRENYLSITTPDRLLNIALEWAKVALDKGFVQNPHLGQGLIAGFGRSGVGNRPGFGWFFGGDAFLNSMALNAASMNALARKALEFLIAHQRDDGKIMHELSQSGGLIDWFGQYHYGFIHGETTPFLIVQMADYLRYTGDTLFISQNWEALAKAYRFCLDCDANDDGLMDNNKAGLGASEVGPLRQNILTDIYIASVWIQALKSMQLLSGVLQKTEMQDDASQRLQKALKSFERFWNREKRIINFALTRDGGVNEEITPWPGIALIYSLFPADKATAMIDHFISSELTTDWGTRMLSNNSEAYDPLAYNNGAVWPFLTGLVSLAEYRYNRPYAGYFHLRSIAHLTFENALGYQTEILSGNRFRPLDASVPHQLFSTSQYYNAFIRGLCGLDVDAVHRRIVFTPRLPADWDSLSIRNLIIGKDVFSLHLTRNSDKWQLKVNGTAQQPYTCVFSPGLKLGAKIVKGMVNGHEVEIKKDQISTLLSGEADIDLLIKDGLAVIPPIPIPHVSDRSRTLRIISHTLNRNRHTILVEGVAGQTYKLGMKTSEVIRKVEGAQLGPNNVLRISLEKSKEGFIKKKIIITTKSTQ